MRRTAVGIIAAALLIAALVLQFWPAGENGDDMRVAIKAACVRVGALMGAWWLAYREVERLPRWVLAIIPALILILAIRPRLVLFAIPVIVLLLILKPRSKPRI